MRLLAVVRWRVGWPWYVLVILGPAGFVAATSPGRTRCSAARGPQRFRRQPRGRLCPALFLVVLTLTDGVGEELAWRGFALPRLLSATRR